MNGKPVFRFPDASVITPMPNAKAERVKADALYEFHRERENDRARVMAAQQGWTTRPDGHSEALDTKTRGAIAIALVVVVLFWASVAWAIHHFAG